MAAAITWMWLKGMSLKGMSLAGRLAGGRGTRS